MLGWKLCFLHGVLLTTLEFASPLSKCNCSWTLDDYNPTCKTRGSPAFTHKSITSQWSECLKSLQFRHKKNQGRGFPIQRTVQTSHYSILVVARCRAKYCYGSLKEFQFLSIIGRQRWCSNKASGEKKR